MEPDGVSGSGVVDDRILDDDIAEDDNDVLDDAELDYTEDILEATSEQVVTTDKPSSVSILSVL